MPPALAARASVLPCRPMTRRPPPPNGRPATRRGPPGPNPRRRAGSTALPRIILAVFGVLAVGLFALVMSVYASYTSGLPDVAGIEEFDLVEGSTVLSGDGTELARFAIEDRREITFDQIPQVMLDAQVAAEDRTFWTNPCIDFRGIVRAALQNFQAGETVSGASTICQQLVRMRLFDAELMADPDRQVERKIKEAILALRLDDRYPGTEGKERIIKMYLNQVYYGNNAYGVWAAARAYFEKDLQADDPAQQLTISEAAFLAGLVRAPSRLDPTPEAVPEEIDGETRYVVPPTAQAITVRNIVLDQLLRSEFITQAEHDAAVAEQVVLAPPADRAYRAPHFVYAVRREAADLLDGEDLLDRGGLVISTTLDYNGYQVSAEKWAQVAYDMDRMSDEELVAKYGEAALAWIAQLQGRNINNDALVSLNYRTGAVLAYVGSANYYGEATPAHQPAYDVIGQAYRQSGSAFKPITYATGFERGTITPATMLMDVEGVIAEGYSVPDADGRERGPGAGARRPEVLAEHPGHQGAAADRHRCRGQHGRAARPRLGSAARGRGRRSPHSPSAPSACTCSTWPAPTVASPTAACSTRPYLIERIEDSRGNVIYDHATDAEDPEQVLSAASAYLVTDILADNTDPATNPLWGPASSCRPMPAAGRPP